MLGRFHRWSDRVKHCDWVGEATIFENVVVEKENGGIYMTCKLCDICGGKIMHERRIVFYDKTNRIGDCDVCPDCMRKLLSYLLDLSDEDSVTISYLKENMEAIK